MPKKEVQRGADAGIAAGWHRVRLIPGRIMTFAFQKMSWGSAAEGRRGVETTSGKALQKTSPILQIDFLGSNLFI